MSILFSVRTKSKSVCSMYVPTVRQIECKFPCNQRSITPVIATLPVWILCASSVPMSVHLVIFMKGSYSLSLQSRSYLPAYVPPNSPFALACKPPVSSLGESAPRGLPMWHTTTTLSACVPIFPCSLLVHAVSPCRVHR